jgi:phosphate-selective porin OprO/OprP
MLIALLTAALSLLSPPPQQSQDPSPGPASAPAQGDDDEGRGVRFVWNDHPSLRAGDELRVDFIGKFQWDARQAGDDPEAFESTELHRARIGIEARFLQHFELNLERELTEREIEGRTDRPWKDAYLNVNYTDYARVRLGKFKVPFGLDQLTSISNIDFIYRSLAGSYLTPGRDVGVMVYGQAVDNRFDYWGGVFKQDGENARSRRIQGADRTGAVRATFAPFRRPGRSLLDQLEIGSAFAVSNLSNDESVVPNGLRGRTTMSRYVFFEPVFVEGQRRRFEIDADWQYESVGIRAEYMEVRDTRRGQGFADNDLPDALARSWYVSGAVVVTGEMKNRPVVAQREFGRGGVGAVELVARFERIRFGSVGGSQDEAFRHPRAENILSSGNRVLTTGVNWYMNQWFKLQVDAVRERLDDPERSPIPDNSAFWSGMTRLQVAF